MMIDALVAGFTEGFGLVQQDLFEGVVQPLLFSADGGHLLEDAFDATGWMLVGLVQVALMLIVLAPLERLWPVERQADRRAVRTDVLYTLIHRLGVFRLALFFTVQPLWEAAFGWLTVHGVIGWQVDQWLWGLWPGVTDTAVAALVLYLLVFDLADYLIHRGQHRYAWWWALHALHHSQRQMTMWSDNRNHFLDDVLRDTLLVVLAHAIGVPPGQFIVIVAITQLVESFSHANLRLSFGRWGEWALVSPRFHRVHHHIGIGHEGAGTGAVGGCNFAVLFPIWDRLVGTADVSSPVGQTGILDQLPGQGGRDYGHGLVAQQWLGLKRLWRRA